MITRANVNLKSGGKYNKVITRLGCRDFNKAKIYRNVVIWRTSIFRVTSL